MISLLGTNSRLGSGFVVGYDGHIQYPSQRAHDVLKIHVIEEKKPSAPVSYGVQLTGVLQYYTHYRPDKWGRNEVQEGRLQDL